MSDGAEQIKNALGEVFDLETLVYMNDLWHVEKNMKEKTETKVLQWNRKKASRRSESC